MDNECIVCYEPNYIQLYDCGHGACHDCTNIMIKKVDAKCPMCRKVIHYRGIRDNLKLCWFLLLFVITFLVSLAFACVLIF